MPHLGPPIVIDPIDLGDQTSCARFGASACQGPILFNGALYIPLIQNGGSCNFNAFGTLNMFKSVDGGLTWTALDTAHTIQSSRIQANFDGNHTWGCACYAPTSSSTPLKFISFDLSTELWGAVSVDGPHTSSDPFFVVSKSTGESLIGYLGLSPGGHVFGVIYNGAWGIPFQIDTNIVAAHVDWHSSNAPTFAIVDSSDRIHMLGGITITNGTFLFFYQQFSFAGVLGSFFEFPDQAPATPVTFQMFWGQPAVVGDHVVFPFFPPFSSGVMDIGLYVGSTLAAPSWAFIASIDPAFGGVNFNAVSTPTCMFDGTTLNVVYEGPTADNVYARGIFRYSGTVDFITSYYYLIFLKLIK